MNFTNSAWPPGVRPTILVVDDQAANVLLVHQILGSDAATYFASDGEQALERCGRDQPDLILLDLHMPGMDGLETCRRLQALDGMRDVPVIFITGSNSAADENACWEAGAVDFVSKPLNPATLRNRVRVHLTLKRQADLLRQLASVDPLTGLGNRRHFDELAAREWRRAQRSPMAVSVLMVDIDYFKRYNDLYGHPAGDRCLVAVAAALAGCAMRAGDLVIRYGGEEFIMLLPDTDEAGAKRVAESALAAVQALELPHANGGYSGFVSVSIGVATAESGKTPMSVVELVELADRQLYRAKANGRAQVAACAYDSSPLLA